MTTRTFRSVVAAAALSTLALTACSGGDSDAKNTSTPQGASTTSSPAAKSADPNSDALAAEAAKAGVDPANPPKAIVSAVAPAVVEGDPKATMKIDVLGLKRQGKTVIASYAFTVTSPAGSDKADWLYDYLGGHGWNPALVDSKNLKLHKVVRANDNQVASDYQGAEFRPGQTFYAYAVFAAPPEDVTTMDVLASDGVPAFPTVPLS